MAVLSKSTLISVSVTDNSYAAELAQRIDAVISSLGADHDVINVSVTGVFSTFFSDVSGSVASPVVLQLSESVRSVIVTVVWREPDPS